MSGFLFSVIAGFPVLEGGDALAQCPGRIPSTGNLQCIFPSAEPQNALAGTAEPADLETDLGAIAIDLNTGDIGASMARQGKRKAEREASDGVMR